MAQEQPSLREKFIAAMTLADQSEEMAAFLAVVAELDDDTFESWALPYMANRAQMREVE